MINLHPNLAHYSIKYQLYKHRLFPNITLKFHNIKGLISYKSRDLHFAEIYLNIGDFIIYFSRIILVAIDLQYKIYGQIWVALSGIEGKTCIESVFL